MYCGQTQSIYVVREDRHRYIALFKHPENWTTIVLGNKDFSQRSPFWNVVQKADLWKTNILDNVLRLTWVKNGEACRRVNVLTSCSPTCKCQHCILVHLYTCKCQHRAASQFCTTDRIATSHWIKSHCISVNIIFCYISDIYKWFNVCKHQDSHKP